jgi:hypothetical protein
LPEKEISMKMLDTEFWTRFDAWLKSCQNLINDYFAKNYTNLTPPTLITNDGSKLLKIVKVDGSSRSAWAFIALVDFETKVLGKVLRGDVLKPASWRMPAKHARGNIFDEDNGMGIKQFISLVKKYKKL